MSQPVESPASPPATVLIVDDEDGIRQVLHRFLTRIGYSVVQAHDAGTALEKLREVQPQAMVCDIRMPNMTGVELVPKALAETPDLAVLMLTAIDEPRTAIECLKLGAHDYLIKPVDLDELELALKDALRRRQLEIERRQLEQWLAREVAERTRDLEERTAAIGDVALDALASALQGLTAKDTARWQRAAELGSRLAKERGLSPAEVADAVRQRGTAIKPEVLDAFGRALRAG